MTAQHKLDDLKGLVAVLQQNSQLLLDGRRQVQTGTLYCPTCGDDRRMTISVKTAPDEAMKTAQGGYTSLIDGKKLTPSLFFFSCVQCLTPFTAVIYKGPEGPDVAVLSSCHGGLTTPHTPVGVTYYLDQARRAEVMGARSAAVAMFRGALEHLLFEQGYKTGMLGKKLETLETDISKGAAPKWAMDLETEFLTVLKDLGNASIHPNDGDVTKQDALDGGLLARVRSTFQMLLFLVYEAPHKKQEHLNALKTAAQILRR